jgi:hypothetical protein
MLAIDPDVKFRGGDAGALHTLARQRDTLQVEACNGIRHGVERETGVQQCADGHVATDSGKSVEKSDSHGYRSVAGSGSGW